VVIAASETLEPKLPEPGRLQHAPASSQGRSAAEGTSAGQGIATFAAVAEAATANANDIATRSKEQLHLQPDEIPTALDELVARGLMASAATKLLDALSPEQLQVVPDYIEYWDAVKATKDVGPGFLYELIRKGDALPSTFETSRSRAAKKAAEERHNRLAAAKQGLEVAYADYERATIDRFIEETIAPDELERRIAARKKQLGTQSTFWDKMQQTELTHRMAEHDVRMEIAKHVSRLSFEDFARREAPRILIAFGLDPAEIGIDRPAS
jgi:hypothetical protein